MVEYNSANIYSSLNDQKFKLIKISEDSDCFIDRTGERELISKKFSKYITLFYYFDKSLIVLSATSGNISIASFLLDRSSKCKF